MVMSVIKFDQFAGGDSISLILSTMFYILLLQTLWRQMAPHLIYYNDGDDDDNEIVR